MVNHRITAGYTPIQRWPDPERRAELRESQPDEIGQLFRAAAAVLDAELRSKPHPTEQDLRLMDYCSRRAASDGPLYP